MDTLKQLKDELTQEYKTTKQFFASYPEGKGGYAPHEKSMKMSPLANHIANIFAWAQIVLDSPHLDMGASGSPKKAENGTELQALMDKGYNASMERLDKATEKELDGRWRIRAGGKVLMEWSKYGAIRHSLDQITHHRAQLGVYYRLLGIPVPPSYGPSADVQAF